MDRRSLRFLKCSFKKALPSERGSKLSCFERDGGCLTRLLASSKLSTNNEDDEYWRNLNDSELYSFETLNAHRTFVLNSLKNISDVARSFPLDISRMERGAV